jgi:hypothetical protein
MILHPAHNRFSFLSLLAIYILDFHFFALHAAFIRFKVTIQIRIILVTASLSHSRFQSEKHEKTSSMLICSSEYWPVPGFLTPMIPICF